MWEKSRRCFWNKKINQSPDAVVLAHARVCATSERKQGQRKKVFGKGNNSLPRFSYMSNTVTVAAAAALTPRMRTTSRVGVRHTSLTIFVFSHDATLRPEDRLVSKNGQTRT